MPIHREVNKTFFKTWSPEMAYVLGFFAADGSMIKNNRGAHFIEFTVVDRVILDNIKKVVGSNHKISVRKRYKEQWKTQYRLQIGSKEWFEDLTKAGFTSNKSKSIKLPKIPHQFVGFFVRGYFDGDGCVYFKKHFSRDRNNKRWVLSTRFVSGSRGFLSSLHKLLGISGVRKGFIIEKSNKGGFELVFSHKDSLALYQLMYHNLPVAGLCLPRKYNLFTKAMRTLYPNVCGRSSIWLEHSPVDVQLPRRKGG